MSERIAVVISGTEIVNQIVFPEGAEGDALLSDTVIEITGMIALDKDGNPYDEDKPEETLSPPGVGNGWTYVNGEFVPPPPPPEPLLTWDYWEREREFELEKCAWSMLQDAPLTEEQLDIFIQFRNDLRAVNQVNFPNGPETVVFPERPDIPQFADE